MALVGKNPTIKNLALTTQDVEVPYELPTGTKKFTVQCRTDDDLKLAYTAGESGSNFISIPEGASKSEDNINSLNLVLYLQSPTASVVAEIESWTTE